MARVERMRGLALADITTTEPCLVGGSGGGATNGELPPSISAAVTAAGRSMGRSPALPTTYRTLGLCVLLLCAHAAICRAREVALVTNTGNGTVSVVDTALREVSATIAPGVGTVRRLTVSPDGATLFARSEDRLSIVELPAERIRTSLEVSGGGDVIVTADGTRVYVGATDHIAVIDPQTGTMIGAIPLTVRSARSLSITLADLSTLPSAAPCSVSMRAAARSAPSFRLTSVRSPSHPTIARSGRSVAGR